MEDGGMVSCQSFLFDPKLIIRKEYLVKHQLQLPTTRYALLAPGKLVIALWPDAS
jgi:hypothetical protein